MVARSFRPLIAVLVCLLVPAAPGAPDEQDGQRVIIQVNRNRDVKGYVLLEDEHQITIRTRDNLIERFPKSRVLRVVRLVKPKRGQTGIVVLRNGQRRTGVIIEDAFDHVVLEIEGLRATLPRDTVDYVVLEPTFEQRYRRYKEALRPNVPEEHLELCRWLIDLHKYELARAELVELIERTQMPEAQRLLRLVNAQLTLSRAPQPPEVPPDGEDDQPEPDETDPLPDDILSYDDVNLIRVYEIDFKRPPKISIDAETIRTLIGQYSTSRLIPATAAERQALFRADPLKVAELMFTLRAREFYPQIHVLNEPWTLNLFRQRVHNTWLLNNCATSRCHGGADAGRFFLHQRHYKDPRVRYTNLLILERLELEPDWPLINYDEPRMSLIIQYGLPRHTARKPHPDVKGWKPVFGHGSHRMLQDTITWIESMMQPRPEYPVEYEPPVRGADPPADAEPPPPVPEAAGEPATERSPQ